MQQEKCFYAVFLLKHEFLCLVTNQSGNSIKCSNGSNQNKRINHVHQIFCPHVSKQTLPQKTGEYQQNKKTKSNASIFGTNRLSTVHVFA